MRLGAVAGKGYGSSLRSVGSLSFWVVVGGSHGGPAVSLWDDRLCAAEERPRPSSPDLAFASPQCPLLALEGPCCGARSAQIFGSAEALGEGHDDQGPSVSAGGPAMSAYSLRASNRHKTIASRQEVTAMSA